MLEIGFTGTRRHPTEAQIVALEEWMRMRMLLGPTTLHHGDCVGADEVAHDIAYLLEWSIVVHPPRDAAWRAWCDGDQILPEQEYRERNQAIVDVADVLVAAPHQDQEVLRSGTWMTVRMARRAGVPVVVIYPDGTIERQEN